MHKIKIKFIVAVITLLFSSFLGILKVFANDGKNSLELSPMYEMIILSPGETYTSSVDVMNPSDSDLDLNYKVSIGPFNVLMDQGDGKYGGADTTTITNYNQIIKWITLDKSEGTLKPGEKENIPFTVNVPEEAPAGGQYATIIFENTTKDSEAKQGKVTINSNIQIAYTIYAEVTGETKEVGEITENNIPTFLLDNTLKAASMVKNNGNIHADASYILQVWPIFSDEEICTNEEKPATNLVMPETEKYHTENCQLPAVGIFRAKQTVKIFGEESIVEKTIIVCPIWLLFIIIFAIFALIFYFITRAKARKKTSQKINRN